MDDPLLNSLYMRLLLARFVYRHAIFGWRCMLATWALVTIWVLFTIAPDGGGLSEINHIARFVVIVPASIASLKILRIIRFLEEIYGTYLLTCSDNSAKAGIEENGKLYEQTWMERGWGK